MSYIAGKVLPIFKGEYVSTTTYERLDLVTTKDGENSTVWMSKVDDNTGNIPSDDSEYWTLYLSVGTFVLNPATEQTLGGVRIGDNINVNQATGTISVNTATDVSGGVLTDALAVKLAGIESKANNYSLPKATSSNLGGVTIGDGININDGKISVSTSNGSSTGGLMTAGQATKLAGIAEGANKYSLPRATSSTLGGVTIGSGINVSNGNISVSTSNGSTTGGLMTAGQAVKLNGIAEGANKVTSDTISNWGYTKNAGTITSVKINGSTVSTGGEANLGTVLRYSGAIQVDGDRFTFNTLEGKNGGNWCRITPSSFVGEYDFLIFTIYIRGDMNATDYKQAIIPTSLFVESAAKMSADSACFFLIKEKSGAFDAEVPMKLIYYKERYDGYNTRECLKFLTNFYAFEDWVTFAIEVYGARFAH